EGDVSNKVIPTSSAFSITRREVSKSASSPKLTHPRPSTEISSPVCPRGLNFICARDAIDGCGPLARADRSALRQGNAGQVQPRRQRAEKAEQREQPRDPVTPQRCDSAIEHLVGPRTRLLRHLQHVVDGALAR